jgi:hypothetical protein
MSNANNSDRPGFVGSLPADEHLQKLAQGPTASSLGGAKTDWKQVARQKVLEEEARTVAMERELKMKQEEESPADEGTSIHHSIAALVV